MAIFGDDGFVFFWSKAVAINGACLQNAQFTVIRWPISGVDTRS